MPHKILSRFAILGVLTALAACAKPAPPPVVVAPPPPPPVVIPPMPTPPLYAATRMAIPPMGVDGRRITVNSGIGELETLWHLRSALNVAALNCVQPKHYQLANDYNTFLSTHKRTLSKANRAIESKFRKENGSNYRRVRDTHSTRVYNFFSLPPVKNEFCDVALTVARQLTVTPKDSVTTYAYTGLTQIESVFNRFFSAYEQYQRDLAAWNATYAPQRQASSFTRAGSSYNSTVTAQSPASAGGLVNSRNTVPRSGDVTTTTLPPSSVNNTQPDTGYIPSETPQFDPNATVQPLPGSTVQAVPAAQTTQPAATTPPIDGYTPSVSAPGNSGAVVQPIPATETAQPAESGSATQAKPLPPLPEYDPNLTVQPLPGSENSASDTGNDNAEGNTPSE